MAKTFKVNGKEYVAREFSFNLVCDLEDMGIQMEEFGEKPISTARAYFALCTGRGKDYAGKEMEQHLINGGNLEEIIVAMEEEMEKSDFFRTITKTEAKETGKSQK